MNTNDKLAEAVKVAKKNARAVLETVLQAPSVSVEAPTGTPARPWTEQECQDAQDAMRRIVDGEKKSPAPAVGGEPTDDDWRLKGYAYASKQATNCAGCGKLKHTPLRIDAMGGYVCLTCIDQKLGSLLGEFGYPEQAPAVGGDGMLPDALVPHAKEWYRLCERRSYVDRMTISGPLAQAIVEAVDQTPPATQGAVTLDFPGLGRAGPFKFEDGKLTLPAPTMNDLAYYFRQRYVHATQGDARDAERYRYIAAIKNVWSILGAGFPNKFPSEDDGCENLSESIDAAIAAQAGGEG